MAKPGADIVITQGQKRIFRQPGGARPNNPVKYAGKDTQFLSIQGATRPIRGGVDPIYVPDPDNAKEYLQVGRAKSAPDLPTFDLMVLENHGGIPFQLSDLICPQTFYINSGKCKSLSDFLRGWSSYVEIYADAEPSEGVDMGDRTSWDSDDQIEDTISHTAARIYAIGQVSFGPKATTQVDREVIDIVYGSTAECGDCGPQDTGTNRMYAVVKSSGSGSPGLPGEVVYSVDGGLTWNEVNIDSFGATEDPVAIDMVGDYLVVVGSGAYYYALINRYTGAPGTFTKVSSGFVTNKAPNDIYVLSPREVYFVGNGGYIYRSTEITSGVSVISAGAVTTSNLYRIKGDGFNTVVAVGASDSIVRSLDRGNNWSTPVDTTVAGINVDLTAIEVLSELRWWIGSGTGRVYYTLNGGNSYVHMGFSGAGAGSINDIVFATDEVGYFSHTNTTPDGRLFATWNGGADWTNTDPRLTGLSVVDRINRFAYPKVGLTTAANNLALACLGGDGTDGLIQVGMPNIS